MSERDDLIRLVASAVYGEPENLSRATETADAILAAGYCKPRVVTTVEERDSLPELSVVHFEGLKHPSVKYIGEWISLHSVVTYLLDERVGKFQNRPSIVLYEGSE